MYRSETSKFRHIFTPYCKGIGLDIGAGGDPVVPDAITVDLENPYAECGAHPVNIKIPNGTDEIGFHIRHFINPGTLDYVYSSHLLEDFDAPFVRLNEWALILKQGGYLCLLLPDEQRYRNYCNSIGAPRNINHKNESFCLEYVKEMLLLIGLEIIQEHDNLVYEPEKSNYNFAIIAQK